MDEHLKRSIMIEHYQNPLNKGISDTSGYKTVNMNSKTCIDNLDFALKVENGIIKDVKFDGEACAISTSSASIMTKLLKGKTINEAEEIINNYENMIEERPYDKDVLGEANCYDEIYKPSGRNRKYIKSS